MRLGLRIDAPIDLHGWKVIDIDMSVSLTTVSAGPADALTGALDHSRGGADLAAAQESQPARLVGASRRSSRVWSTRSRLSPRHAAARQRGRHPVCPWGGARRHLLSSVGVIAIAAERLQASSTTTATWIQNPLRVQIGRRRSRLTRFHARADTVGHGRRGGNVTHWVDARRVFDVVGQRSPALDASRKRCGSTVNTCTSTTFGTRSIVHCFLVEHHSNLTSLRDVSP
jgi:hypothetical protein